MSFSRQTLLGTERQKRLDISDLKRQAHDFSNLRRKVGHVVQESTSKYVEKEWFLSQEEETHVKGQIVEAYGKRLWEEKSSPALIEEVKEELRRLVERQAPLPTHQLEVEVHRILHELIGWGHLDELLEDQDITEIIVQKFSDVIVERKSTGRLERLTEKFFFDEEQLLRLIEQIAATMGREFNESKADLHTQLPDGSRLTATHRSISPDGHMLTIRKHRDLLSQKDYLRYGSLCKPMLSFLKHAVGVARASGIVSGGTGSGKTHLLNLISQFISPQISVITIEDVLELKLQHPFVRRFLTKPANHEGKGGFSIRDCVRLSLRKRPDVIIVGETRGGEIIDIIWAMNTDHPGSWSTAHANSPRALIDSTLPILFGKAEESYSSLERNLMIGSALDLIVQVKRFEEDGSRKVISITEVIGTGESDEDKIRKMLSVKQVIPNRVYLQDIYVYEPMGVKEGKIVGQYRWTGYRPEGLIKCWKAKGISEEEIDAMFFTEPIKL
ncbi:CpaF family protein [Brevibacillus laterosporus]|uniref:CpaF family protein n=1 Tax=Brevibacillus laterosporus TaxID=1465 RepID=UPI000CE386D9|nr:ATPase, T2SS/T4P/T4SS family [Brevibacillus laterosporus]MED1663692.1 ATPase, T2SS/T4P/T4SS family [Brevibacillus laterosporus]MED1671377.1 ATPase, T2SS/T4P/T4SS family [Brevibacillus laterosporus]MED1719127.1 ATPase, T2SS/T4P/T4SS family [Brevibacillus laterosporus]PPA86738.1 CpaF family protein [Brevibacillus laterosporus]